MLAHRQNDVLRLLTVISVTLLPLTLVTGIFGMNVLFPGEGTHEAFWVIVGALLAHLRGDARLLPLAPLALDAHARRPANKKRGRSPAASGPGLSLPPLAREGS